MPDKLQIHIDRLTELETKLSLLAHRISFIDNNGGETAETVELIEHRHKVTEAIERLRNLKLGIDVSEETIKRGVDEWVDEEKMEQIKERLERSLAKVDKEIKSALRVEKKAIESFKTIDEARNAEKKAAKKSEPTKKVEAAVEKKIVAKPVKAEEASHKITIKKEEAVNSFKDRIDGMGTVANDIMRKTIEDTFDTKGGKIIGDKDFVKQLNKLTNDALELLQKDPKFSGPISQFIKRMPPISEAITDFQKTINDIKVPSFDVTKKIVIDEIIDKMLDNGLNQNFVQPLRDLIYQNVTSGLSLTDAKEAIKEYIKGGKDVTGKLGNYLEQTAVQAVDGYSGAINKKILENFDMNGLLITGSLIDNSSPQCRYAIEKLGGKITRENWKQVEAIGEKQSGWIEGTTFDNLPLNKLHWGCRHSFYPIIIKKAA